MNDNDFLAAFEDCSLPFEQWTHRAHVRVAYLYATSHDLPQAINQIRSGIQAYNKANQRPESIRQGYHETITGAFMRLVWTANRLTGPFGSSDDFCDAHGELLEKSALASHYSKRHLWTAEAKHGFVEPDLAPLPVIDGRQLLLHASAPWQCNVARALMTEFAESLDFDLCFQGFEAELAGLPGRYAAPDGRLLLSFENKAPTGCVALRRIDDDAAELKRLWVRPPFRGHGVGRRLAETITDHARQIGYRSIKLDTLDSMTTAIALYRNMGFVECNPYNHNPVAGAMFMELTL